MKNEPNHMLKMVFRITYLNAAWRLDTEPAAHPPRR